MNKAKNKFQHNKFDDIKEAEKTAIKTRKKYMPFSLEGTNR